MAKDPTQGPLSTYDEFGNPIKANVDEPIVEAAEEVIAEDATEEESEEATTEETVEEATDEEEASEDGVAPAEELWDRLTEVGAESDPETGVVRHVEFTCDRCGETKQGMLLPEGTVGFYALDDELGWAKYANEGEEIICDACMQSDERYLADYPDELKAGNVHVAEATVEETAVDEKGNGDDAVVEEMGEIEEDSPDVGALTRSEIINKFGDELGGKILDAGFSSLSGLIRVMIQGPDQFEREEYEEIWDTLGLGEKEEATGDEAEEKESDVSPVEEEAEFVTHEHEVKPPLTYNEAETMLMETSFVKMKEMAVADGIKPERSRVKVMRQLLEYWFPAPTSAPADDEPEMSVRIRRAKGLM